MKLYGYFRSSAAYRVRIALNLKGLSADNEYIHLQKGAQTMSDYLSVNPQGLVPALVDDGNVILQSLAICEYLDEQHPEPPLLPADALGRARVRALSQAIACEIHPLNNLRVLKYLTGELGLADDVKSRWYQHWVAEGFRGLEGLLTDRPGTGKYCHGNTPGLADICLVPQVFNARRFDCDLTPYPTVVRIANSLNELPAFADAAPEKQPDAA